MGKSVIQSALITAGTTVAGTPPGVLSVIGRGAYVTIYIESNAGVASGAITVEEAMNGDYTGTWSVIGTATTVPAAGALTAVHLPAGSYQAIRVRVTTDVVGGTVDVWGIASE